MAVKEPEAGDRAPSRSNEALAASERRLRSIIANEPECLKILDLQGRLVEMNPAGLAMLEIDDASRVVGRSLLDFVAPEHRARMQALMERVLQGSPGSLKFEIVGVKGTRRWMDTRVVPLRDEGSEQSGILAITRDITEQRRAEQALRQSEERFRQLAENIRDVFYLADRNRTRIDYLSPAYERVFGRPRAEALADPLALAAAVHPEDRRAFDRALETVRATGSADVEYRIVRPDGEVRWIRDRTFPVADAKGATTGSVAGIAEDVTDRKQLEESLRKSSTMAALGSLVGAVAHEVRNPLFAISSTLDALELRFASEAAFRPYFANLRSEVDRLGRLVTELLDYGRARRRGTLVSASLSDVLTSAAKACLSRAREAGVSVIQDVPPVGPILMDRARAIRAFENLLQNAIAHSPSGGVVKVRVGVGEPGAPIVCTVEDHGPGISEKDLPRLFEPFFSRRPGGTGLGLSIVNAVADEHGWTVRAANRPGGGAVFTVEIPRLPRAVQSPASAMEPGL